MYIIWEEVDRIEEEVGTFEEEVGTFVKDAGILCNLDHSIDLIYIFTGYKIYWNQ